MTNWNKFLEFLDQLYNCNEKHPSGTTKRDRYYSYPVEPERHNDHKTAKTGMFNTWYCYRCDRHYREEELLYRKES